MFDLATDRYEVTNLFNVPAAQTLRDALRAEFDRQMRDTGLAARLTNPAINGGAFQLNVTGGIGPRYQLESSADLQAWSPVAQIKMTGTQASVTDPNASPPRRSYRLQWISD